MLSHALDHSSALLNCLFQKRQFRKHDQCILSWCSLDSHVLVPFERFVPGAIKMTTYIKLQILQCWAMYCCVKSGYSNSADA